jgi:hypothetical protein
VREPLTRGSETGRHPGRCRRMSAESAMPHRSRNS